MIEKDIEDLKHAFKAFIEVRIKEEVELKNPSPDKYWDADDKVREKYKKVLEYL